MVFLFRKKQILLVIVFLLYIPSVFFAQMFSSTCKVDWTKQDFYSTITLDANKAGIIMPSGRKSASDIISLNLSSILKDPLLTLYSDSAYTFGDMVLKNTISLEDISYVLDNGNKKPSIFSEDMANIMVDHSFSLYEISSLMILHNTTYTPQIPIEQESSRIFSGIIIDARGALPVQGEFVSSKGAPCLFPRIWDDSMNLLYERNMMNPEKARKTGIVTYSWTNDESAYKDRIGINPLHISARKLFGTHRTDPVISRSDALKILSVPGNLSLLEQGKIVILLDKDSLIYSVSSPIKDQSYYAKFNELEQYYYENTIPDTYIIDTPSGMLISIRDINFKPDSAELLSNENQRLDAIAKSLFSIVNNNEYTIQIDGHTASVGKPTGEMTLSIARAKRIIEEMTKRGIDEKLFTYRGFGGTAPLGDNGTEEGRAQNRRVEININPKTTYIQRQ